MQTDQPANNPNVRDALNTLAAPHGLTVVPAPSQHADPNVPPTIEVRKDTVFNLVSRGVSVMRDLLKETGWKQHWIATGLKALVEEKKIQKHPEQGRSPFTYYTLPGAVRAGSIAATKDDQGGTTVRPTGNKKPADKKPANKKK
jgi:hypothetical protein